MLPGIEQTLLTRVKCDASKLGIDQSCHVLCMAHEHSTTKCIAFACINIGSSYEAEVQFPRRGGSSGNSLCDIRIFFLKHGGYSNSHVTRG